MTRATHDVEAVSQDLVPPSAWTFTRLTDLVVAVDVRARDIPHDQAVGLEVLSLTKNEGLVRQTERFAKRIATADVSNYKVVRRQEIVYNPYVIWEGAIHSLRRFPAGLVSPVYPVLKTREFDGGYLDYLLRTPALIAQYNRLCSGAVNRRRSIRPSAFLSIEVTVPPLPERRAIAALLRLVERAKEACEQLVTATRVLKQSLLRHLFTHGLASSGQTQRGDLNGASSRTVAEKWGLATLETLIADGPQNGIYRPQTDYGYGTPIVRIDDFPNEGGVVTVAEKRVGLSAAERATYSLHFGDLLINRVNSLSHLGKTALIGRTQEEMVFESNMMRLSIDSSKALPEFVFRFLCCPGPRDMLRSLSKRAVAQSSINQGDVKSVVVPLPSITEQRDIVSALSVVDEKLSAEITRSAALDRLFESLLHKLMTGKVRVDHLVAELEPEAAA